jgi:hypothetical protein
MSNLNFAGALSNNLIAVFELYNFHIGSFVSLFHENLPTFLLVFESVLYRFRAFAVNLEIDPHDITLDALGDYLIAVLELHNLHVGGFVTLLHVSDTPYLMLSM